MDRFFGWMRRTSPPVGFYAELWRDPKEDPDFPALAARYGDRAELEVHTLQMWLLREVVTAAAGLLYTLGKIEALLTELQAYVDEHVEPWPEDEPWPESGYGISHPLVVEASFEFVNFLSWLRAIDERLDRRHRPNSEEPRAGLLPSLADRPLRSKVKALVRDFQAKALERKLANYVMHTGTVPQPIEGARLTEQHRISLQVPDRPTELVSTRWHLTYEEERDGLVLVREAAQAVASLVDDLLDAEEETRAVEEERQRART
jgi:hypothetical protein